MSESVPSASVYSEIEGVRPLQATAGKIALGGWCLISGESIAPPVRLVAGPIFLTARNHLAREDVRRLLPGQPAAATCGFVIEGLIPAGVYEARFEAQRSDLSWITFKTLTLSVTPPPFAAAIESSLPVNKVISQRVHVEGWGCDARQAIASLSLRYGHQTIPATLGKYRSDLTEAIPQYPAVTARSFKSETILSAGRGPLRLRAVLADGSVAIARTPFGVDLRTDENHGFDLTSKTDQISLPRQRLRPPSPAEKDARPLNILFVLHGSFSSNSALHVAGLANELSLSGHACVVAVPHDAEETLRGHVDPLFIGIDFAHALAGGGKFPNGRPADVIHAWTTRENVRLFCESLPQQRATTLLVHLEDNEQEILSQNLGRPFAELAALRAEEIDPLVPASLSHPSRSRSFLAQARGVTVITDRLREFTLAGQPVHTIWPAADARFFYPKPVPQNFRSQLTSGERVTFVFYHGNVHTANAGEVRELYLAVLALNQRGVPTRLIRCGLDRLDFLGANRDQVAPYVWELGLITHHHHLPPLMALADIFVQPGAADAFNDYRFPSKLPEFFALGRPVILPRTNLGASLRHGIDAYVVDRADADGIANAIIALRDDAGLYETLHLGAEACAARIFSWRRSAAELAKFYHTLAG